MNIHRGNITFIGGSAKIEGSVLGNVYCIGTELSLTDNSFVSGEIYLFSSKIECVRKATPPTIVPATNLFLKKYMNDEKIIIDNIFPSYFYSICFSFINSIIGVILLSICKNFFQQGSVATFKEFKKVIKYGSVFYVSILALIITFIISIIGFPFALFFTLLLVILSCCGSVSLAVCIGFLLNERFKSNAYIFSLYFLGSIIIEILKCLPFLGVILTFVFIPILTTGIVLKTFFNRYIYKIHYKIPYLTTLNTDLKFDREMIKQIILRDLKK